MRSLLDVNVLVALLDADHSLHTRAARWLAGHAAQGWASCPITQNGCVRVMSHASYASPLPVSAVIDRLGEACERPEHARRALRFGQVDRHDAAVRVRRPQRCSEQAPVGGNVGGERVGSLGLVDAVGTGR